MPCNVNLKRRVCLPAPSITDGFDVFVQDVIAAITTEPCRRVNVAPSNSKDALAFKFCSSIPNPLNPTYYLKKKFILAVRENIFLSCLPYWRDLE